jgi:hypothetical protein
LIIVLVFTLLFLIVAAGFFLSARDGEKKGGAEISFQGSVQDDALPFQYAINRPKRTIELETHPIEQIKMLSSKLDRYIDVARQRIEDPELRLRFDEAAEAVVRDLDRLNPEELLQALMDFLPVQVNYNFNLDGELGNLLEELTELTHSLANSPENIFRIEHRTRALNKIESELFSLIREYQELRSKKLTSKQISKLVSNAVGIVSNEELCSAELEKLLNFYYGLRAFQVLNHVGNVHCSEIKVELANLTKLLGEAKEDFKQEGHSFVEQTQKGLLMRLRGFCAHHLKLFSGIEVGLSQLRGCNFTAIVKNEERIDRMLYDVENEYLPMTQTFGSEEGRLEAEFNRHFKKILGSYSEKAPRNRLAVGVVESSVSFFSQRSSDVEMMIESPLEEAIVKILSPMVASLQTSES